MPRPVDALSLLRRDHKNVLSLLHRFEKTDQASEQRDLCEQIVSELRTHTEIEERVFYPYLREATAREDLFQEASIEHQTAKDLLNRLPKEEAGTPRMKAMMKVLGEYVAHHVQEEENEIFPQVERTGVDMKALGQALQECREGHDPTRGKAAGSASSRDRRTSQDARQSRNDHHIREGEEGLSDSTRRAKWIDMPDDHADHDGQTLATRSIGVIRAWANARGAEPATIEGADPQRPRVLRLDFPGYDEGLQHIEWESWQRVFEERELVFLFQENLKSGRQSNFFRLDSPAREDA